MTIREDPLIVSDVVLMSPGKWNGWNYDVNELKKAYSSTNWQDELVTSLFLDHPENAANAANAWIGRVNNPRLTSDGSIKGDLEIWDGDVANKLTKAKAKFGVSPRVIGSEDENNKSFCDFTFDNFSIVARPAQSTAVLQLAQRLKFEGTIRQLSKENLAQVTAMEKMREQKGMSPEQFYAVPRDPPSSSSLPIFDVEHVRNAMARFNQTKFKDDKEKIKAKNKIMRAAIKFKINIDKFKEMSSHDKELLELLQSTKMLERQLKGGKKQMSEEEIKTEETEEENEEAAAEKPATESEEKSEESSEELSDAQVLSVMNKDLNSFNEYANAIRVSNPSISLKELAKMYKEHQEKMNFVEELSEYEATFLLKKLLSKIGVNELSTKKAQPASNELANKINSLEKSIKELNKKSKVPAPKAVKKLATKAKSNIMFGKAPSDGVMELAQMFGIR